MQWRAMSCNNETVRLTVKMHTAGLFLSTDCTQRYAKSRSEGTIGMQSLRSFIHNLDKGARTSIRVSERHQPLVFWESVRLWLCYLWPSLNSRTNKLFAWTRGGNIASWTRMTQLGGSSTRRPSFNKKTVPNIHFPISFRIYISSRSRTSDKETSASGVFVTY